MKTTSIIILCFLSIFSVMAQTQKKKPQNPSKQLGSKVNNSAPQAQIVNIPDANFKAELIYLSVDKNKDGKIQVSEAQIVTSLNLFDRSIASLSGIEAFVNLNRLNCRSNQLTTIDVSKNTALTYLECGSNKLTIIDISKNTALTELSCDNNRLTTLDLSKNIALKNLVCDHNQLTTLNVSMNTALTDLDCVQNQLTTLDLSKNTALTNLDCSLNTLTTIELSNNIALKKLSCSINELTTLDVSQNTALTNLDCSGNQLTTLDVSKNTALKNLECSENPNLRRICINTIQLGLTTTTPSNWLKNRATKWSSDCIR